jgi:hypothetical protein
MEGANEGSSFAAHMKLTSTQAYLHIGRMQEKQTPRYEIP